MDSRSRFLFSLIAFSGLGIALSFQQTPQPGGDFSIALTKVAYQDKEGQQEVGSEVPKNAKPLEGFLVRVPLPITGQVDTNVKKLIRRVIERPVAQERPPLILEFDTSDGESGEGSDIDRCVSLARFLTSAELNKVRTIAYIPASRLNLKTDDPLKPNLTELRGHAVLVALSCQQVIMHENTAIGAAGINESVVTDFLRAAYREFPGRRKVFDERLVMSMLDRQMSLHFVETDNGVDWVTQEELEELNNVDSKTVSSPGILTMVSSEQLKQFRVIKYRVSSRKELAERLGLSPEILRGDPSLDGAYRAVHIRLQGPIHKREIDWIDNALSQEVMTFNPNLILVELDSREGDTNQCIRFAQRLAEFDPVNVRTVAFVSGDASGSTSIIAMACDDLIMSPDAVLGTGDEKQQPERGPGNGRPGKRGPPPREMPELSDVLPAIKSIATAKEKNWSLMAALFDPSVAVSQMRHKDGAVRIFSQEELQELDELQSLKADEWVEVEPIETRDGLNSAMAKQFGVVKVLLPSMEEVALHYQLEEDAKLLEPTLKDRWVQRIGRYFASPVVAGWLLFAMAFFFMVEMSNPGVGVPGFIAAICAMLFFWSQFCEGNAHWLEILLFAVGMMFLAIEVFLVPGVGIFGFGGGLMVITSIVLAMQDFILPRTSEQMSQLPISLSMVIFPIAGFFVSIFVIRRFLHRVPYLNRLVLDPPGSDDELESLSERESLTHFEDMVGKRGTTITDLLPSGKARFNDDILNVITDGRMIEKGESVIVRKVDGNRIEVELTD